MLARLDLCREKGFDGVMLDNVNSYTNRTGFLLTGADQLRFNVWLANAAHERGLAVGMNNNAEQARQLAPYFDWALAEGCLSEGWCSSLQPFAEQGKAVVVIEYTDSRAKLDGFCRQASTLQFSVLAKKRELDAFRMDCRTRRIAAAGPT
jgi:endo-alpha-1,4-polygalactosaminidase (GH114 family)